MDNITIMRNGISNTQPNNEIILHCKCMTKQYEYEKNNANLANFAKKSKNNCARFKST